MEFTQNWFDHNIPVWTQLLKPYVGKPIRVLEVGVFEGRSTCWLLRNILTHPDSRVVCVDTFGGGIEHEYMDIVMPDVQRRFENNVSAWSNQVELHIGESGRILPSLEGGFDLAYIDGSHIAKDVLADAVLVWRLIKDGGIVIFDDYEWPMYLDKPWLRPKLAIDAFLQCHAGWYTLLNKGYQVAVRKLGACLPSHMP